MVLESSRLATEYLDCSSLSFSSHLQVLGNCYGLELVLHQILALNSWTLGLWLGHWRLFELALLALRCLVALCLEQGRCLVQGEPCRCEGVGRHGRASDSRNIQYLVLVHLHVWIPKGSLRHDGEIVLLSRPSFAGLRTLRNTWLALTKTSLIAGCLLHA